MVKELDREKMWEINKAFLDKAITEGKTFVFTSNPKIILDTVPISYSADEVRHLQKFLNFEQKGALWYGIKK